MRSNRNVRDSTTIGLPPYQPNAIFGDEALRILSINSDQRSAIGLMNRYVRLTESVETRSTRTTIFGY